ADASVECGGSTDPADTGSATADPDNCGGTGTISYTDAATAANCTGHAGIDRTWKAKDACNNKTTPVHAIVYVDTTPPSITSCPTNTTVHALAGSCESGPVNYSGTAEDNCGGAVTITFSPPSGSTFGPGVHTVTMYAEDECGNVNDTCTFTVTNDGQSELATTVELGGGIMADGSFTRCITFELW